MTQPAPPPAADGPPDTAAGTPEPAGISEPDARPQPHPHDDPASTIPAGHAPADVAVHVVDVLDALGVAYELVPCDPALADTEAFCAHYGVPLDRSANTILVASKSEPRQHAACVLLTTTRLDVNQTVRRRLGVRRASFAGGEETAAVTGMVLGGVTPVGLPPGLPVWVDRRVMTPDWVILGGGSRAVKLKVSPEIFERLPATEIVDGLALDRPTP